MPGFRPCCSVSTTPLLGFAEKGLVLDFLQKVSGYFRIQVKRLIQQSRQTGQLRCRQLPLMASNTTLALVCGEWRFRIPDIVSSSCGLKEILSHSVLKILGALYFFLPLRIRI
jgi:hypothetical protein